MPRQVPTTIWSAHDAAILAAIDIVSALLADETERLQPLVADFPTQIASDERLLAVGPVEVLTHRVTGDGSYLHRSPTVIVPGRAGAAAALAAVTVAGAGNRSRRRRAAEASQPRWVVDDAGTIWTSTAGFYLRTASGLFPWGWESVRAISLVGPGAVQVDGAGERGAVSWVLHTDCAELMFILWALDRHPGHPQLRDGGWLPPGWRDRARAHGVSPPPRGDVVAP